MTKQLDELTARVEGLLEAVEGMPRLKDAGYIAPDSEEDHAESKSFTDFLLAVKNDNRRRLAKVYGSTYEEDQADENLPAHVKTALAEGAGATGGYGVPTEYGELLMEKTREFNALRRAGALQRTMTRQTMNFPLMDIETAPSAGDTPYAGGTIAYWTEEAAAISESEPRLRHVQLMAHKLAAYSLASNEIREDFGQDLDGIMARAFAKAVGSKEEKAFFRGDGVGKPLGILESGALISATRDVALQISVGDLAQMISDFVPDGYSNAAWFISVGALDQIVQLVTHPLTWLRGMRDPWWTPTLLGWPLYIVGCLPALNNAGDILLVDPTYYLIGDYRGGIKIAYSEHYRFANDQVAWRVTKRVDGQPLVENVIYGEDGAATYSPFVALAAK